MKSGCCISMVEIENGENLRKFSMERIQIPPNGIRPELEDKWTVMRQI